MAAPTVLIMGPPGAGKGTQAAHLVAAHRLRHVATGDVLRAAVSAGTPLGLEAKRFIDSGDLVPDDVIIGMLRDLVAGLDDDGGLLLDGFPRTRAQAEALDAMLGDLGRRVDVAIDIAVPAAELVRRLAGRWVCRTCGRPYNQVARPPRVDGVCDDDGGELYQRSDDTEEAVSRRLDVYDEQTAPVSDYYDARGRRVVIDGDQDLAVVQAAIDDAMYALDPA